MSINDFEFIRLTDNQLELDDGIYFQIECKKTHKSKHYQRVINKGELGGYVHVDSIQYLQDMWIEKTEAVGKLVTWEGTPTLRKKERYEQSEYKSFYEVCSLFYKYIQAKAGTGYPSQRNAVISHFKRVLDMIAEVVDFERRLDYIGFNNETQLIILWTMIGAIQEAIVKLHILIFDDEYKLIRPKAKSALWEEQVDTIIRTLEKLNHIDKDDLIVLEKINSNRNMVHLLNFGTVFNYKDYLEYVHLSCNIYSKLFDFVLKKFKVSCEEAKK